MLNLTPEAIARLMGEKPKPKNKKQPKPKKTSPTTRRPGFEPMRAQTVRNLTPPRTSCPTNWGDEQTYSKYEYIWKQKYSKQLNGLTYTRNFWAGLTQLENPDANPTSLPARIARTQHLLRLAFCIDAASSWA
jgi:hypothetical protein